MSFSIQSMAKAIEEFSVAHPMATAVTATVGLLTLVAGSFCCCWKGRKVTKTNVVTGTALLVQKEALKSVAAAPVVTEKKASLPTTYQTSVRLDQVSNSPAFCVTFSSKQAVVDFLTATETMNTAVNAPKAMKVADLTFTTDESLPDNEQKRKLLAVFPKLTRLILNLPLSATKDWSWNVDSSVTLIRKVG